MTTAVVIVAIAVVVMAVWFWAVIAGQASLFTSGQSAEPDTGSRAVESAGPAFKLAS